MPALDAASERLLAPYEGSILLVCYNGPEANEPSHGSSCSQRTNC